MNKQLLEQMLGFPDMEVVDVSADLDEKAFRVDLRYRDGVCDCEKCGGSRTAEEIKRESRKHPVRHLDCLGFKTLLYFANIEMKCSECQALFNRRPLFLGDARHMTTDYIVDWMEKAKGTSLKRISEWNDEPEKTIGTIYYRELSKADAKREPRRVKRLAMDEVSLRKGHGNYVLLLYDLDTHEIVEVLPDRKKEVLIPFLKEHQEDMFAELAVVSTDMWKQYRESVKAVFPHVEVVADRFHVEKDLNEALDDCRLAVQRRIKDPDERKEWKKTHRHVLLRSHDRQIQLPGGSEQLEKVLSHDKELESIYWLKEQFRDIYKMDDYEEAKVEMNRWIRRATYLNSEFLNPFIGTVKRWKEPILGYIKHGVTNGLAEGFNCKVKLVKRMAYGILNFVHFRLRILHTCSETLAAQ